MKKILLVGIAIICTSTFFGQVSINPSTTRISEIKTDFTFNFIDGEFNRSLLKTGWLSGIGDYLALQHGGNNTEANTYGLRISDGSGLEFGKNNFNTSFLKINTNGNVGIGTTSPTSRLTIYGKEEGNPSLLIRNSSYGSSDSVGTSSLQFGFSSQFGPKIEASKKTKNTTSLNFYTEYGYNTPQLGLSIIPSASGSNVGIGTTDTKGYKLGVKGKIAAEEVKVALYNTWPDYVFKDNYNLPTLQQVENYINQKGHLINIPSAKEVSENGIQLGAMNAKLLEKIEELTLYTIAQEKQLKEQKNKNKELEVRLAKIETLLNKE